MKALALALALLALSAAPAEAADPARVYNRVANSPDPQATLRSLTSAQRDALARYLTPVGTTTQALVPSGSLSLMQAVSACKDVGHVVGRYNALGVLLWTWTLYAEVCYDGSRITYSDVRHYGQTHVLFWSWRVQSTSKSINTTLNPDRLTAYGQGEFKLCLFGNIGCTTYVYPWNELRFWANGTHSWRWGG